MGLNSVQFVKPWPKNNKKNNVTSYSAQALFAKIEIRRQNFATSAARIFPEKNTSILANTMFMDPNVWAVNQNNNDV